MILLSVSGTFAKRLKKGLALGVVVLLLNILRTGFDSVSTFLKLNNPEESVFCANILPFPLSADVSSFFLLNIEFSPNSNNGFLPNKSELFVLSIGFPNKEGGFLDSSPFAPLVA